MYQRAYKGWERLKMSIKMFIPSRMLRFFPPHFLMRDVLVEEVEHWIRKGNRCILLFFDVKHFAEIKSAYQPHVITQIEDTIEDCFRKWVIQYFSTDVLAVQRYFEDDYLIVLKESGWTEEEVQRNMQLFQQTLEQEIEAHTRTYFDFPIRFHSAYSYIDGTADDMHEAVRAALHDARAIAKKHLPANIGHIRAKLRRLMEEEKIRVLAQPIVSLSEGTVKGWEILTRGPEHTPFAKPGNLFHYAYQTGMLLELELLVLKKSFLVIRQKKTHCPVFINVTVPSLMNPCFFQQVTKLLEQFPEINPRQIVLEISERHMIEHIPTFNQAIRCFRETGFRFALDDTGDGYASLHMIAEVQPEVIKIDRSIVHNIDQSQVKATILQSLLAIAGQIGSEVIVEGIETEAEARTLMEQNIDWVQGYFFSRPDEPFQEVGSHWLNRRQDELALPS